MAALVGSLLQATAEKARAPAAAVLDLSGNLATGVVTTVVGPLHSLLPDVVQRTVRELLLTLLAIVFGVLRLAGGLPRWLRGGSIRSSARLSPPECLSDPLLGRHMYAKINGTKYHYVENGSRRQEMVLLLHDFSDFWYGWRNQLRGLSGSNWVVAPDLKGFGDSDKPFLARQYREELVVEELRQLVDVLQESERRIVLIGHGLGGHLAWRFVEKYPEMVSKFVSISTPHPRVWLRHVLASWRSVLQNRWLYICRLPFLPELEMVSHDLEVFDRKFASQSGVTDLRLNSLMDKEAYKYTFSRTTDWQGPVNYLRNLPLADSSVFTMDKDGADRLIPVEALLITGNVDPEISMDLVTQSAEYLERFAMHIVNGAGHSPHQEQPELVNRHITRFIKAPDVVKQELGGGGEGRREVGREVQGGYHTLPKARQQLLDSYSAPVTAVLDSSQSLLSSLSSTASSLPILGNFLPTPTKVTQQE